MALRDVQEGLRPVRCLDPALLTAARHLRALCRKHLPAYDAFEFFGDDRVVRGLEAAHPVRLLAVRPAVPRKSSGGHCRVQPRPPRLSGSGYAGVKPGDNLSRNLLLERPAMNHSVRRWTTRLRDQSVQLIICAVLSSAAATLVHAEPIPAREQLNAVLWQQRATAYRGLALQAWRQATARLAGVRNNGLTASLEQRQAGGFRNKPVAVVLDVDETVLDNTPFNALLLREGRAFDPRDWNLWVAAVRAAAVPGAKEFVERARSLSFRVVFVTNRECNRAGGYNAQGRAIDCPQKASTLDNLTAPSAHGRLRQTCCCGTNDKREMTATSRHAAPKSHARTVSRCWSVMI